MCLGVFRNSPRVSMGRSPRDLTPRSTSSTVGPGEYEGAWANGGIGDTRSFNQVFASRANARKQARAGSPRRAKKACTAEEQEAMVHRLSGTGGSAHPGELLKDSHHTRTVVNLEIHQRCPDPEKDGFGSRVKRSFDILPPEVARTPGPGAYDVETKHRASGSGLVVMDIRRNGRRRKDDRFETENRMRFEAELYRNLGQ